MRFLLTNIIFYFGCFLSIGVMADVAKTRFQTCSACHGSQGAGNKVLNAPAIAGIPAWYIEQQLLAYQKGERGTNPKDVYGMQMRPMAMTVPVEDIKALASYIEKMPQKSSLPVVKGNVAAGKIKYATCAACHGNQAKGNQALKAPPLNLSNDWYLQRQLTNFVSGVRGSSPQSLGYAMSVTIKALKLKESDISNIVAYLRTLQK